MSSGKLFRHYFGVAWRSTLHLPTLHEGVVTFDASPPVLERASIRYGRATADALVTEVRWMSDYSEHLRLPEGLPLSAAIVSVDADFSQSGAATEAGSSLPFAPAVPAERDPLDELEELLSAGDFERAGARFEGFVATEREGEALARLTLHEQRLPEALRIRAAMLLEARGEAGALALLSVTPVETPEASLLESDLRRAAGDLEGALRAAEAALAHDVSMPGGRERAKSLRELLERARALVTPSRSVEESEEVMRRVTRLVHEGLRAEALTLARPLASLDPRLAEIEADLDLRLSTKRSIVVKREGDEPLHVIDAQFATIGRADADVGVPSPLVSREHLRLVVSGGETRIVELGSRNGTALDGRPWTGSVAVGEGRALVLGGAIHCEITPFGQKSQNGPARVVTPAGVFVVTMGRPIVVGPWRLERARRHGHLCWVLSAVDGASIGGADGRALSLVELLSGDRWTHPKLAELDWRIDAADD